MISDHPDQEAVKVVRIQARMSDKGVETTPVRARWPRIRWPTTPWLKRDGGHQECPSERRDKEGMGGLDLDGGGLPKPVQVKRSAEPTASASEKVMPHVKQDKEQQAPHC